MNDQTSAADILDGLASIYRERNAIYGSNFNDMGPVMAGFFPNGITLRTPEDHIRFHLFMLIMVKMTRYANSWANGHSDSLRDGAVYCAMLDSVDYGMRCKPVEPPPPTSSQDSIRAAVKQLLDHTRGIDLNDFWPQV